MCQSKHPVTLHRSRQTLLEADWKRWFAWCTVRYFRLCCRPPLSLSHHGKPFTSTCGWKRLCLYISLRQGGYVFVSLLVWLLDEGSCRQIFMNFFVGLGDVSLATKITPLVHKLRSAGQIRPGTSRQVAHVQDEWESLKYEKMAHHSLPSCETTLTLTLIDCAIFSQELRFERCNRGPCPKKFVHHWIRLCWWSGL